MAVSVASVSHFILECFRKKKEEKKKKGNVPPPPLHHTLQPGRGRQYCSCGLIHFSFVILISALTAGGDSVRFYYSEAILMVYY